MPKQKTIVELNAEKEKIEQQLTQEQHKKQRLENRIAYYERGDRTKRAHNLIVRGADNSEVTALSIAGIRVPEMKKAPSHFILSAVSNSYSIIQIRSNYVKLPQTKTREQRAEKRPQNTPKNRLSVNHFGHHLTLFLPSFWPVNHLRTTKNWVKTVLVFPNLVKLYQPV